MQPTTASALAVSNSRVDIQRRIEERERALAAATSPLLRRMQDASRGKAPPYGVPPFAAQMTAEELKEFEKQLVYDTYQATKSYAGQPGQW